MNVVRAAVKARKVNLLAQDRTSNGDETVQHELPVDSKLKEFTVSVSGDNPRIAITDPHGSVWRAAKWQLATNIN